MNGSWLNIPMALLVAVLASPPAAVTDSLEGARELYAAAEYERALTVLEQLRAEGGDARDVSEYRAYCLLALGKAAEADQAIAAVVVADPFYLPSGADVSPRVVAAFHEVRRRMLPDIIQRKYVTAKSSFDAREFGAARDAFDEVLAGLSDSDVVDAVAKPPLSDLRTLANGFRELSAKAAVPPVIPARTESVALSAVPQPPRIYNAEDRRVTPPGTVQQRLPPFLVQGPPPAPGVLEFVIDEKGAVESASMKVPMNVRYDSQLIAATRDWKFTPATVDGLPVKYRKTLQVAVEMPR